MQNTRFALSAALACALSLPVAANAQSAQAKLTPDEVKHLAAVQAAILVVQDSVDKELSAQRNKKDEQQAELREKMRTQVAAVLKKNSLSDSAFQRRRFIISTDNDSRKLFDSTLAVLTGAPLPGQVKPAAAPVASVKVPATAAGMHIGHVVNSFDGTPDKSGLLPMAVAEQKIAAQHATLAMRNPMNLSMLQLHAGHIIHAIDPTIVAMGPGKGYGVKKAANGIAQHIELAAMAQGATPPEVTHSKHIATAARATVARADQIVALAQKVQSATDAKDAAQFMSQIVILCDQLQNGADANSDGRITWEGTEGGLQQVQEHVTLMLAPPKP
ncbi:MAG: hypothetical protein ACO1Q7_14280 [Gemmatimonas sp.]